MADPLKETLSKIAELSGKFDRIASNISVPAPEPPPEIEAWMRDLKSAVEQLTAVVTPARPPAMDPLVALQRVAEAIRTAEETLNGQNLVIATGSVEMELEVKAGDAAGAHAKIQFQITPKPYN